MTKGLTEPHVLLASSNPQKLIRNLAGVLTPKQLLRIEKAVDMDVKGLFQLGVSHHTFAQGISANEWRQKASRLYYAAYNIRRAVQLKDSGAFSTDSSDHQKVDLLPDSFPNSIFYRSKLKNMRDDRNLADYSHIASKSDLLISLADMERIVSDFISDARTFIAAKGLTL